LDEDGTRLFGTLFSSLRPFGWSVCDFFSGLFPFNSRDHGAGHFIPLGTTDIYLITPPSFEQVLSFRARGVVSYTIVTFFPSQGQTLPQVFRASESFLGGNHFFSVALLMTPPTFCKRGPSFDQLPV